MRTRKTDGVEHTGRGEAPILAYPEPGDDRTWMVAEDPAFSLEERDGTPRYWRA